MRSKTVLVVALAAGIAAAQDTPAVQTRNEKISYALGMDLGNQLRKLGVEIDPAIFSQGLKDAISGGKVLLTETQVREAISELQADLKQKEAAQRKGTAPADFETELLSVHNRQTGEAFLSAKRKEQGVVTTPSGLQYRIMKAGDGKKPSANDTVTCHYRGVLTNGTEFYDTHKSQKPITVKVSDTIKAFQEALPLMPVGSKWELFVPPDRAYGASGAGPVGPNETLVYEVELLSIQ